MAMKIAIYGAGAIGGYLGAKLAVAGDAAVTLIARGPHLEAIRRRGLVLRSGGEETVVEVNATDAAAEVGPQDYVFLALKAHSVVAIVERLASLLGEHTAVVTAQNGVPWWYFYGLDGPYQDRRLESVDPGGTLWRRIGPERAIGCVVYPSCELPEPGVVEHLHGNRFMLGEPDGSRSERIVPLSQVLTAAGLKAPVRPRIRDDLWLKLWGNLSFNPVSVLTHASLERLAADRGSRAVVRAMMVEAQAVAEELGVRFAVDVDTRIRWAAEVGNHKTSMLQDLESGRPLEIEALVGAVAEMARLVELETPTLDLVLGLIRLRAAVAAGESRASSRAAAAVSCSRGAGGES